jgi:hypothetical protein
MDAKSYNPVQTTKVTGDSMGKMTAPLWIESEAWKTFEALADAMNLSRSALIEMIAAGYTKDAAATLAALEGLPGREEFKPARSGPGADFDYSKRKPPRKRKGKTDETAHDA